MIVFLVQVVLAAQCQVPQLRQQRHQSLVLALREHRGRDVSRGRTRGGGGMLGAGDWGEEEARTDGVSSVMSVTTTGQRGQGCHSRLTAETEIGRESQTVSSHGG